MNKECYAKGCNAKGCNAKECYAKDCKPRKVNWNIHEDFKVCLFMIFIISLTALAVIGITLYIEGKIDSDKISYEELVKSSKKTIIISGYWPDGGRVCTKSDPCIMNCLEYSRYDLGCGPEDPDCTYGHYDWCREEPVGGQL